MKKVASSLVVLDKFSSNTLELSEAAVLGCSSATSGEWLGEVDEKLLDRLPFVDSNRVVELEEAL